MGNPIRISTRVAGTNRGRNHQVMFVPWYLHKFSRLHKSRTKKFSHYLVLLLIFGLASALNLTDPLQDLHQSSKGSLQCAQWQVPFLIRKKGKIAQITTLCRRFSFVVNRCTTCCHSLSLVVSFFVTHFYPQSIVVTRDVLLVFLFINNRSLVHSPRTCGQINISFPEDIT